MNPTDMLSPLDVSAQWVMAFAAIWLFAVGVVQCFLSYWGIKLLNATLSETRRASDAAAQAAQSTKVAAEAAYTQASHNRAWLSIETERPGRIAQDLNHTGTEVEFELHTENVGDSPAINLSITVYSEENRPRRRVDEITVLPPLESAANTMQFSVGFLGKGKPLPIKLPIDVVEIEILTLGHRDIILVCDISYGTTHPHHNGRTRYVCKIFYSTISQYWIAEPVGPLCILH